jgi:UDPglucose 6-dehydrogenase
MSRVSFGHPIGFIGQGMVGKHLSDNFEARGAHVIRYSIDRKYRSNKQKIGSCPIVFICVPTPATVKGLNTSAIETGLGLVAPGSIAVIKSTVLPGTTQRLQSAFLDRTIICSPEFLRSSFPLDDAAHPSLNIVGLPVRDSAHEGAAKLAHNLLPQARASFTCHSGEAELVKFAHMLHGYTQVVTFNLLYDVAKQIGANWRTIHECLSRDPMISPHYITPIHKGGRGAAGTCFLKDFSGFVNFCDQLNFWPAGLDYLKAAEQANIELLHNSGKDLHIVAMVYGSSRRGATRARTGSQPQSSKRPQE